MNTQSTIPTPYEKKSRMINVGMTERLASTASGALLLVTSLRRGNSFGLGSALTGAYLVYRGLSGHCNVYQAIGKEGHPSTVKNVEIHTSLTVNKPRSEVYAYWRKLENLPNFMTHLESVNALDERRSQWKAQVPGGIATIDWEAEIVDDRPDSLLSWRSMPDADIENAGRVEFQDAPGGRGTELHVTISYHAPGGRLGKGIADLFSPMFEKMIKSDIHNFKSVLETGEVATVEGQPSGRH